MNTRIVRWIKEHDVLTFFLLVFVLVWPKLIVDAGYSQGVFRKGASPWLSILYILGLPLFSAAIVTALRRGRMGLKEWGTRLFRWRVNWRWYLFVLLSYPAVATLAYTLSDWIQGRAWSVINLWKAGFDSLRRSAPGIGLSAENTLPILLAFIVVGLLVSIVEEAGWRAYAVPRLQEKYSSLLSGLIVGLIWACWHVPYFFTKGVAHHGLPFAWFLLTLTSLSIVLVWVMNHTNQSAWMAVLFHASFNLSAQFLPTHLAYKNGDALTFWLTCLLSVVGAFIIISLQGSQLGRKPSDVLLHELKYESS